MRVCTVICGHIPKPVRHLIDDYGVCFEALLAPHLPGAVFQTVSVIDGERVADLDAHDAYVFSGSPAGVYDDLEWIRYAEGLVRDLVGAGKIVVGICFGHQLIAQALGGRVEKSTKGWGMGVHQVALKQREPWMVGVGENGAGEPNDRRINVIVSHQDQVIAPPEGATVLISTDFCPVGMMRLGDRVITMQGHPEMDKRIIDAILEMRREIVGPEVYSSGKASLDLDLDHDLLGAWIASFMKAAVGKQAA